MTFEEFCEARLSELLRFATVLAVDRGIAEDVVQDVLARAYPRWVSIGVLDRPDLYVRRMIVNEYLSWRRKWSRVVPHAELAEVEVPDQTDRHADRALLADELASLPRRQRAVLVLRYYGGLSDEAIARDLGCTVGTVRSHASRALASLRIQLAPDRVPEET